MLKASWVILVMSMLFILLPANAYAQEAINVTDTTPCFLNYTASYDILSNCNAKDDPVGWISLGWLYITGGYFSMIIVTVIVIATYMKFKQIIYPIFIGIVFMPISFFVFPDVFLSWGIMMAFVGIGILIWYAVIRQTKEY